MIKNIIRPNISRFKYKLKPNQEISRQKRLAVGIAKWKFNAQSPVMLMVDDFTNAYVHDPLELKPVVRGDWGGLYNSQHSIIRFLETRLLNRFPSIRITFFAVVGPISQYTHHQPFTFAKPMNADKESINFFRKVGSDSRFEIAYHGFNHGTSGKTTKDFTQEWSGFKTLQSAIAQNKRGKQLYKEIFGYEPLGGKYGGWSYNDFADESIDLSGFRWWCRDWMPRDTSGKIPSEYYEPQIFGKNGILALPSTIHGYHWTKKQIDLLLAQRQVISIEEHIAALRPDGLIQTPNVYDDMPRLLSLFNYLRGKNLWYATGTEIADYYDAYLYSKITDITVDRFRLEYCGKKPSNILTLIIQPVSQDYINNESELCLICPEGRIIRSQRSGRNNKFLINIPVKSGNYKMKVGA